MKDKIIKIIISVLLCICAIFLPIQNLWIKPTLFIISYLVVGFEVIKEAIEKIIKKDFFKNRR